MEGSLSHYPSVWVAFLGGKALSLRLRLGSMLRRHSLPDLLRSLTPERIVAEPAPLAALEQVLCVTEGLIESLFVVPDTCLYRSLARYAVLRSAGHPARFVMAVKPRAPEITGHAWVELFGEPVGETVDPGLIVTFAYPRS